MADRLRGERRAGIDRRHLAGGGTTLRQLGRTARIGRRAGRMIILHRGKRRLGLGNDRKGTVCRTIVGNGKRTLGRRGRREAFLGFENTAAAVHDSDFVRN
jgi:hypothetical protein